ncbi:B12-binding domain-containing radical SAM protein [Candidatus Omnitrophota bacterium]
MKILLVNPPLTREEIAGRMKKVINLLPPLGIGYIAAVLEKAGFAVKILDCPPLRLSHADLGAFVQAEKPDIIGFTASTIAVHSAGRAAVNARSLSPESLLVIGGSHVSALPEETMSKGIFDVGVIGEGEQTFLQLALRLRSGSRDFADIAGLIYHDKGRFVRTESRTFAKDLDSLPFPALHLFPPLSKYYPMPGSVRKKPYVQVMSSRGCPYRCTFCDRATFGGKYRARSPQNVVDEIEMLIARFGVKEIKFNDDTFNVDEDRVVGICEEIIKRRLEIIWTCRIHARNVSVRLLKIMKHAGCWQIGFGIESGDRELLARLNKSLTLEQALLAVAWAKEADLNVKVSFMFGLPGETQATMARTITFAKTLLADIVNFHVFIPFPGTEIFRRMDDVGRILHRDYEKYCQLNVPPGVKLPFLPQGLSEDDIRKASVRGHRSFYLRPSYLWRQLRQVRSFFDIWRYWQGLLTVAGL